ncbi:hypothetical protein HBI71_056720 [Parastagonospora nodorum]|nr:hypothetical protein HBI71_056720 [Parastagonospora nodorum]KAH6363542.1 hypothetical protein HBI34_169710 [Parastagonospora nodorum]
MTAIYAVQTHRWRPCRRQNRRPSARNRVFDAADNAGLVGVAVETSRQKPCHQHPKTLAICMPRCGFVVVQGMCTH